MRSPGQKDYGKISTTLTLFYCFVVYKFFWYRKFNHVAHYIIIIAVNFATWWCIASFPSFLTGDSRKILDTFLRKLLQGDIAAYPKPKSFKLTKNQLFGEKDTVFDYVYDKRNNGTWIPWMELEKEVPLSPTAKVRRQNFS